jgi:hypothetical protein
LFRRLHQPSNQRFMLRWFTASLSPARLHFLPGIATPVKLGPLQSIRRVDLQSIAACRSFNSLVPLPSGAAPGDVGKRHLNGVVSQPGDRNKR